MARVRRAIRERKPLGPPPAGERRPSSGGARLWRGVRAEDGGREGIRWREKREEK
jgi:hypothetical protein